MYRILIVDDEEMIVNSLASYMEDRFDAEIHRAYSAIAAMEYLRQMRFHVVITDISMPAVSGLELLDFIKKYWPECRVIILTAYSNFQYAYDALHHDGVDYLLKIEDYDTIGQTVQKDLKLIEEEQQRETFYTSLDQKISLLTPYIKSGTLDKLLRFGTGLEQEALDALEIPLLLQQPILPVIGLLTQPEAESRQGPFSAFLNYIQKTMVARGIDVVFHSMDGYHIWLLQQNSSAKHQTEEDAAAYIREIFSELPEKISRQDSENLALVISSQFVDVTALRDLYRTGILLLEGFRGESGMRLIQGQYPDGQLHKEDYPGSEDLGILLALVKSGDRDALLSTLSREMAFLKQIEDLRQALPLPAVTAMEMLLAQARQLCGTLREYGYLIRNLYLSDHPISGSTWLTEAVTLLKDLMDSRVKMKSTNAAGLISRINTYINSHYMEDLSLTSLANMFNYNPSYLSRLYKEQSKLSLVAYINEQRINKAKLLLESSPLKISDISAQVGFYSTTNFNQVFKKQTGITAHSYRQSNTHA